MQKVYYPVARADEIPAGEGRQVTVGSDPDCVVFHSEDGRYFATGSLCPHQNERLDLARLEGCEVICRRHHLRFDLNSGDCTNAGGFWLHTFDVKIEDGDILVAVWED